MSSPLILNLEDDPDDDVVVCGACGEEGHSYRECWAISSDEGCK